MLTRRANGHEHTELIFSSVARWPMNTPIETHHLE